MTYSINFEPNLKRKQRRQALRFGLPIVMFLLLLSVLVASVYYAREHEREQNQTQLIADTLWARQNLQFEMDGFRKTLKSMVEDPFLYSSSNFEAAARQLATSNEELIAIFKSESLELLPSSLGQVSEETVFSLVSLLRNAVRQRLSSGIDGLVGPFAWEGKNYVAVVAIGQHQTALIIAIVDLNLFLNRELPWWFAQKHQVELVSSSGSVLARMVKGKPGAGVYEHSTILELGNLPLTLRVESSEPSPRFFNYGTTGAVLLLLSLLLISFFLLWNDSRRRLKVEAHLEEEKLFRQSMQDSIAVGMRVWDLNGVIRYVNPSFCKLVGYSADELIGVPFPLPYWPSENTEAYPELVAKVIAGETPRAGFETVYQHREGHFIDVLIVEAPLRDSSNNHIGWMSSVLDITDRKRSEAVIEMQREQLQAASRFALVGEVASNISHELNQPLASMVSFAQAGINLSRKGAKIEKYVELFTKICDQALRASQVVSRVQNLVRKRQPLREQTTIRSVLNSIRFSLDSIAAAHSVNLNYQLKAIDHPLYLDRIMVEQALINLVKNASEAFESDQFDRKVTIQSEMNNLGICLIVSDNGPGIALNHAEKLFESLFSTKSNGLGLGLSLCRSVAEAHGGRLTVKQLEPIGTEFTLSMPMAVTVNKKVEYATSE